MIWRLTHRHDAQDALAQDHASTVQGDDHLTLPEQESPAEQGIQPATYASPRLENRTKAYAFERHIERVVQRKLEAQEAIQKVHAKRLPRGRRDTAPASRAAAVALAHYIHYHGLPETRTGFLKLLQDYAVKNGLHLSDELRDDTTREFIEAVLDAFEFDKPDR
jgi:hypothetical protein